MTAIEEFSSEYFIIDAQLLSHPGKRALCDRHLYEGLRRYVSEPVIRVGGEHEWLTAQEAVPAETVVVPEYMYHPDDEILIARNEKTVESFS